MPEHAYTRARRRPFPKPLVLLAGTNLNITKHRSYDASAADRVATRKTTSPRTSKMTIFVTPVSTKTGIALNLASRLSVSLYE